MFNRPLGLIISMCMVATSGVAAHPETIATNGSRGIPTRQVVLEPPRSAAVLATDPSRFAVVRDIKLEAANPIVEDDVPAATLKFDIYNELDLSISDVVVAVSILGGRTAPASESRSLLVRPFKIRMPQVVEPGYSVHYEVRMKNLSGNCDCIPKIEILEVRVVGEIDGAMWSKD